MNERLDQASKLIQASPSDIYAAFTTTKALEKWLPPQDMTANVAVFDFREGGGYQMRLTYNMSEHTAGKTSEHSDEVEVRFIKLVQNERIEQGVSFISDKKEFAGEMQTTWFFDETEDGTNVTVECRNVPDGIRPVDHKTGLTSSLETLAAFVEQSGLNHIKKEKVMQNTTSKSRLWTARIMSGIVILFMLFDSIFKFIKPEEVVQVTLDLGYAEHHILVMGILGLLSILLYTYPKTSILGVVLLTGYWGGAIATHVRLDNPLFSHILFPVYLAILAWGGIWLREEKLRDLIPFKKKKTIHTG